MFTINDVTYSQADVKEQKQHYRELELVNQHQTIAVCVEDSFVWLTLCYYLKEKNTSVMPIHASVPRETALSMATKAGCSLLIYGDITSCIELSSATGHEGQVASDTSETTGHTSQTPSHTGIIQMSSGTTGEPKCILRSWADIDIEIKSYCRVFSDAANMTPIIACPITHSYGLICGVMVALERGQHPLIINNINPKYILKKLRGCERPLLYSSPVMLRGLLNFWPVDSKLFAAMTSGSTMSEQVFTQIRAKVKHLYQQYGCSEAGCISISQSTESANELGTPLTHVSLQCSDDENAPSEIIAEVTTANGIKTIHTQDLGYISNGGRLHFISRLDDTIIVSGLNVYPAEVEDIILRHPQVNDAIVFKIEDALAGHRVGLQYVTDKELQPQELRQWCSQNLAAFQIPQVLQPVDTIPRLANSKVNRKQIAAAHKDMTQPTNDASQPVEPIHYGQK